MTYKYFSFSSVCALPADHTSVNTQEQKMNLALNLSLQGQNCAQATRITIMEIIEAMAITAAENDVTQPS